MQRPFSMSVAQSQAYLHAKCKGKTITALKNLDFKLQLWGKCYQYIVPLPIFLHSLDTNRTFQSVRKEQNFQVNGFGEEEMETERSFRLVPFLQLSLAVYILDRDEWKRDR